MNKMHSTQLPPVLHTCAGVWFFNLNPVLIPGAPATEDTQATADSYECDSMALVGAPSRASLISAGVAARYSKDDEIAVLNNKLLGDDVAYASYTAYRNDVKAQVDAAGFPSV